MSGLTHLQRLEAESIHIMREVVAEAERPVMLYSVGKDSAVMLHLAKKAFFPARPPFPLLHVDTTWKFRAMYALRDKAAADAGMELIVHKNPDAEAAGINPFDHGSRHTDLWKTEGLKQALKAGGYDVAFGGARRDEEKSRAKERIFSFRSASQGWDPKAQRPELWNLYNARIHRGESIRVFPLSNWTELDVWQYIQAENIPVVPLYFAKPRPVVRRAGTWIMVDDERFPLEPAEARYAGEVAGRWRYADGAGEIGLISSVTEPFCRDCHRARLSADGKTVTLEITDLKPVMQQKIDFRNLKTADGAVLTATVMHTINAI